MTENYKKAQRLIKEGYSNVQDKLIEVMMDIKRNNPGISHPEVMDLFQYEIDKFMKFHKNDRSELPKSSSVNTRVLKDKMSIMKIPYGDKRKKGV